MKVFKDDDHLLWMQQDKELRTASEQMLASTEIEPVRLAFGNASAAMIVLEKQFGHSGETNYYEAHCPMAFDNKGGNLLQSVYSITNPFYGSSMLNCGSIKTTFAGVQQ